MKKALIINQDQADAINKQVEVYEHDLMFSPDKTKSKIHVFWHTPMGGLQCGIIKHVEILRGWYFAPNLTGLKEFNARQLITIGTWVNELNKITHAQKPTE